MSVSPRRWSGIRPLAVWVLPLIFILLFFFYPLGVILTTSAQRFTGELPATLWQNILRTTGFTFWQAILSTAATILIGLPAAYVFSRYRFPGLQTVRMLVNLPFILPTVVVAAAFNALIGPRGLLNLGLQNLFHLEQPPIQWIGTLTAIVLAHVFYNLSIVVRLVGGAWTALSPHAGQTARTLGASPWQEFRLVTFPLLKPAFYSALVLVFLYDFTSFGVVLLLGGIGTATLEVEIYKQAVNLFNLPVAAILTMIQMICTILLTWGYRKLSGRPLPLDPAGEEDRRVPPRTWFARIQVWLTMLVLAVLVAAPLASLLARSFLVLEADRGYRGAVQVGLTLRYYAALFKDPQQSIFYVSPITAVFNSLKVALSASLISCVVGLFTAYGLRQKTDFARWMDQVFLLPLGASAVTLGLGLLLAYSQPPFLWSSSWLILPAVHALAALPFVIRSLQPALSSIPSQIQDSAAVLGAAPGQVLWRVEIPIIRRALLSSFIFAFTISLGEFGATAFLTRPDFPTIPVAIFRYLSQPGGLNYGQALAMSVILLMICSTGILLVERLRMPDIQKF